MGPFAASYILLVASAVRAFQYTELAQYVDSHQEEYVEVNLINGIQKMTLSLRRHQWRVRALPNRLFPWFGFRLYVTGLRWKATPATC